MQSQVTALRQSNATTLMLFAFGTRAIQAFVAVKRLGWKPQIYINAVAAATSTMQIASTTGQTEGAISIAFFKDPADPSLRKDKGYLLYRRIMRRYLAGEDAHERLLPGRDGLGLCHGRDAAQGRTQPHAASVLRAVARLNFKNPFTLPGHPGEDVADRSVPDRAGAAPALAKRPLARVRQARDGSLAAPAGSWDGGVGEARRIKLGRMEPAWCHALDAALAGERLDGESALAVVDIPVDEACRVARELRARGHGRARHILAESLHPTDDAVPGRLPLLHVRPAAAAR